MTDEEFGELKADVKWIKEMINTAIMGNGLAGRVRKLEVKQGWISGVIAAIAFGLGILFKVLWRG